MFQGWRDSWDDRLKPVDPDSIVFIFGPVVIIVTRGACNAESRERNPAGPPSLK